jgi:hypothetical protein
MNWLINLIFYQATWFICIFGGNSFVWIPLILLLCHFYLSQYRKADLYMVLFLSAAGISIDGILKAIGFFSFGQDNFPIPFWLLAIWVLLATTPNHSLSWLKKRPLLSAIFGFIGGPLAYLAGVRLGAAEFNWSVMPSLLVLGIIWSALWPMTMWLSNYLIPAAPVSTDSR